MEDSSEQIDPVKRAETREVREAINEAVKELPVLQRESVLMYYYEQLSIKEISVILNVNENTVKSRLRYARKYIREYLEKSGNGNLYIGGAALLALISHSLINAAENQEGLVIPYKLPDGKITVATAKYAPAALSVSAKAAAMCCVGIAALSGFSVFAYYDAVKPSSPVSQVAENGLSEKNNSVSNANVYKKKQFQTFSGMKENDIKQYLEFAKETVEQYYRLLMSKGKVTFDKLSVSDTVRAYLQEKYESEYSMMKEENYTKTYKNGKYEALSYEVIDDKLFCTIGSEITFRYSDSDKNSVAGESTQLIIENPNNPIIIDWYVDWSAYDMQKRGQGLDLRDKNNWLTKQ